MKHEYISTEINSFFYYNEISGQFLCSCNDIPACIIYTHAFDLSEPQLVINKPISFQRKSKGCV